jgi:archaemetzincin
VKPGLFVLVAIILLSIFSCRNQPHANRVLVVQPFTDIPPSQATALYEMLKKVNPKTIIRKAIIVPESAFYAPRNRYRADSVINYLDHFGSTDTVVIGITSKDISTRKGNIADWGVMGLGFEPGNACVISTFRLSKANLSEQFYKLALHELGHTQGLPHCNNKTCFMHDAEGGNHFDEEADFCQSCKAYLKGKGWLLNN